MSVEMPKYPYRERGESQEAPLSEEIKAVLGFYELTRRYRAKVPEDPEDVDKPRENISESVGDHVAMTGYLMHYFLPLLEQEGKKLHYEKTFNLLLAHDIGHIGKLPSIPAVQKTHEQKRAEIIQTAQVFADLPRRGGFNRELFDAYGEYLGQKTAEARFMHALNGLETMLYVLSRPPELRKELVADRGYAIEDYRERIEPYCREFKPLHDFYTRIERLFHAKGYFAASRMYENKISRPDTMQRVFISHAPDFGDPENVDVNDENERLLLLQRLKRRMRFGQEPKPEGEHHDTVPEHVAELLFLNRYFMPAVKKEVEESRSLQPAHKRTILRGLDLRNGNEKILAHDAPEAITGDVISLIKKDVDALEEWHIATEIAADYAPRAGGFNDEFWNRVDAYESDRAENPFIGTSWLVKALDLLEAQYYIFDRETRKKLWQMRVLPRDAVHKKAEPILQLFPVVQEHFLVLEQKFRDEGLP